MRCVWIKCAECGVAVRIQLGSDAEIDEQGLAVLAEAISELHHAPLPEGTG